MFLGFLSVRVRFTGDHPRNTRRVIAKAQRTAFRIIATWWHRKFRPKHFTIRGAREYSYQPRGGSRGLREPEPGSYTARKKIAFGHTRPLEWSGESKALTRIRNIRFSSTRARVVMRAPTLNFKSGRRRETMRDELTRISRREKRSLIRRFQRVMNRETSRTR